MLRRLFRLLVRSPQAPTLLDTASDQVILYARIDEPSQRRIRRVPSPSKTIPKAAPQVSHRERLLSMKLEHTRLCSAHRCERLNQLGIVTAGDLASVDPQRLANHFSARRRAANVFKRYRRAIRLAASVPGMMPRDAMLLISVHRRSVRGLASESPSALHRDLKRYAESTKGRLQLRGRPIPSTRRLKRWINQCETMAVHRPLYARAA